MVRRKKNYFSRSAKTKTLNKEGKQKKYCLHTEFVNFSKKLVQLDKTLGNFFLNLKPQKENKKLL